MINELSSDNWQILRGRKLKKFRDDTVCVLGLGYVGLTLAVAMAGAGFNVIGVEMRDDVVDTINNGKAHFYEPGLDVQLSRLLKSGRFQVFKEIPNDWGGTVFIVTVGTPLDTNGQTRLDMVEKVCKSVASHIKEGDFVIMRSTLKLGTTRKNVDPILSQSGKSYDLAYCPERTLEGKALSELEHLPQIVGGMTNTATIRASQLFQHLTPTVVRVSDAETGEMIKLIDNASRDVQFAYANEVAKACDAVGISAIEVIEAGKLGYPRTSLPLPGLVGGPCLEKDPHILAEGLRELGMEPEITMAARKVNEQQPTEVISYLRNLMDQNYNLSKQPIISILGIAFKGQPPTSDLRGTMALPILKELRIKFPTAIIKGFDAVVSQEEIKHFGLDPVATPAEAFEGADLVLITNNHPIFLTISIEDEVQKMADFGIVYDFWNCFRAKKMSLPKNCRYIALGSHVKDLL